MYSLAYLSTPVRRITPGHIELLLDKCRTRNRAAEIASALARG